MIPEKRREFIIKYLESNSNATIAEIGIEFKISEVTVRRDLKLLGERGVITKIYGGASAPTRSNSFQELNLLLRIKKNHLEKQRIAQEAIKRVSDNDTIFVHSGSTCLELVKRLPQKKNINVITVAPHILNQLCQMKNDGKLLGEILCSGGLWMGGSDDLFVGPAAISFFKEVIIKTAFFGLNGLNLEDGWMSASVFETELVKTIISRTETVIGLLDHTKFDTITSHKIGPITLFNEVITDSGINKSKLKKYREVINISIS